MCDQWSSPLNIKRKNQTWGVAASQKRMTSSECDCVCYSKTVDICWPSCPYQSPAEEHRASAVMGRSPGDELLNMVQLATCLYCPLQLVLQTLLEVLWDFLWRNPIKIHPVMCNYWYTERVMAGLWAKSMTLFFVVVVDRCSSWRVGLSSFDRLLWVLICLLSELITSRWLLIPCM